MYYWLCTYYK